MNLFKKTKVARDETPVSSIYPITHLNTPFVFESKSSFQGAVLKVQGIPFITQAPETLNQLNSQLHQAMLHLDERFIQYVTIHRKKENIELQGAFKSNFARHVNDKYHARFAGKNLYHNSIYLTTVLKGDTSSKAARSLSFMERLKASQSPKGKVLLREENLTALKAKMQQLKTSLSPFKPCLLGDNDQALGYSELLAFLSLIPNGGDSLPFQRPCSYSPIAKSIPEVWGTESLYPDGHLGQYLCNKQLYFGQSIQFQGAASNDVCFAAILSVKQYGQYTASVVLDSLLELDCEFILTHSFAPIPREVALDTVNKKREKLINAHDASLSQINHLSVLEDGLSSQTIRLGYHHNTLMLVAASKEELEDAIREAVKIYAASGMVLIRETIGQELAFWAQLPTNHHFITRSALITSHNFVDFCSLHNYETGFRDGNHLGAAVTLLETPSRTPVYFNYHSRSSKTNPAKGHTAIYGATNAGKNTLVAFLDAQMGRYNNRSFFLDRDEASKIYVLSCGNSIYSVISPEYAQTTGMNPLQLPDTPKNRSFVKDWLGHLVKKNEEEELSGSLTEVLNESVNYVFEHLEPHHRTLTNLSKCLPYDFPRWFELRRWLKGHGVTNDGEYAWLFDNEKESLCFDFDKVGFDITYLMDEMSSTVSTPVYMYLLHRMRLCLDGRLTSFIIDEAWQVLGSRFWKKNLKSWLATIRKKNGHFIFMTQAPESVVYSDIASDILTNVATTIYFPNPTASESIYLDKLNLSRAELAHIKHLTAESRQFLVKQGQESMLCTLDLSALADEIRVFSGYLASVRLLDNIITEVGDNPDIWLPVFLERSKG
ncbi:VirB4 family type IV secretion/conjugal transfer ATPase [Legionella bozemanae]|uniref:Vir protein n=1 Tax=Legionella bozemanae TaxID=447 RepID=A0A0W0RY18_LEGBO|nr:VirB4 family type IV secretion/conjugal transfer ATPase [Legionella bozemanae]KTC75883.1 vir protein [Legionella bozemanae]STO35493.1 Type IV secretion system protein virB4 [Legionella bozemanae]